MTMLSESKVRLAATDAGPYDDGFGPAWAMLDDSRLLAHYLGRRGPAYFPLVDPEEASSEKIAGVMSDRFEFNGESYRLPAPIDWLENPSRDVEWHILLHKFYYAPGLGLAYEKTGERRYAQRWMALIDGWIKTTPPGFIAADVTGRRVQNWIYSYYYFVTHAARLDAGLITADFHRRLLASIHQQVEYLCANLTPKRNHRTLELYAIFLAGVVFPEMRRAEFWRRFALEQIELNMASDLLADGVHCELSSDYHHLVLKNYLNLRRLAALNEIAFPAAMDQHLQRALEFSMHLHKPDGVAPSFSDGDARGYLDLLRYGAQLYDRADFLYVATQGAQGRPPVRRVAHFAASGYSVIREHWGEAGANFRDAQHLVFDCGPLGEGNHGHFDALSFELAAFGQSLVVDPGRYTYSEAVDANDGVNWRVHFRGTAAHNTVCVDGRQQTGYVPKVIKDASRHLQGTVRHKISGPPAQTALVERFHGDHLDLMHGRVISHEYDAVHHRCIVFVDRTYWLISDWLRAPSEHSYRLNFQLAAAAQGATTLLANDSSNDSTADSTTDTQTATSDRRNTDRLGTTGGSVTKSMRVLSPGLVIAQLARGSPQQGLEDGWVSPRYGCKQRAPAVRSTVVGKHADFDSLLYPWKDSLPRFTLSDFAVAVNGQEQPVRAIRIELQVDGARVSDIWFHSRDSADRHWRIAGCDFVGRWVYWRETSAGRVLRAVSHPGASLRERGAAAGVSIELGRDSVGPPSNSAGERS